MDKQVCINCEYGDIRQTEDGWVHDIECFLGDDVFIACQQACVQSYFQSKMQKPDLDEESEQIALGIVQGKTVIQRGIHNLR